MTYGKTVGGGFPIGVVCGDHRFMKRFRHDRPADICFARGTFNSHPYVMAAMNEFLLHLETPGMQAIYRDLDATWQRRTASLNQRLAEAGLPITIAHLSSVWTVCYTAAVALQLDVPVLPQGSGLALSWIGTGRLIFSLNFSDADFEAVAERFLAAAEAMRRDGWWEPGALATDKAIKRRILREMLAHAFPPQRSWGRCGSISGSGSSPPLGGEVGRGGYARRFPLS